MITNYTQSPRFSRRLVATIGAGILVLGLGATTASAKEIGSGAGTGVAVCSPVSSLVVKAAAKTADVWGGSIDASYGVKPCTASQAVTVTVTVAEYLNPSNVVYSDTNALLNGKFFVAGIPVRTTFTVTIAVFDAVTGASLGAQTSYIAAIPKGV